MQFSTSILSLWVVLSSAGMGLTALAATESQLAIVSPSPLVQAFDNKSDLKDGTLTLLRFETESYLVRVYRQDGLTYLNVYNKETGYTDKNEALAYLVGPETEDDSWRTYANQQGDLEYRAGVNPRGDTALEIRLPEGPPAQPEYGFNVTYSFPHVLLGSDLDATLSELEASGWSVESSSAETVELTRNQLGLELQFEPSTNTITYTHLIDLT